MTDNIFQLVNIHDLYWKGKSATEMFLIAIPLFLAFLILLGSLLNKNKKSLSVLFLFVLNYFVLSAFTLPVNAVCPVCTVAIGAGLGFSRLLGIDDLITSIWMGGLVISTINWILSWLEKRKIKSLMITVITYLAMYALVIVPLGLSGIIGVQNNVIFDIDKVLLGIIVGSIFFIIGMNTNNYLKKRNNSLNYIPFQKVVLPIIGLWIATLSAYYIIYYYI